MYKLIQNPCMMWEPQAKRTSAYIYEQHNNIANMCRNGWTINRHKNSKCSCDMIRRIRAIKLQRRKKGSAKKSPIACTILSDWMDVYSWARKRTNERRRSQKKNGKKELKAESWKASNKNIDNMLGACSSSIFVS